MNLNNSNLLLLKKAIWFKLLAQKKRLVSKWLMHYIINIESLFYKGVYLFRKNIGWNSLFRSKLDCHNLLKTNIQASN